MKIRFWGVRGSTPVPGPQTVRYGGNTTCVSVRVGENVIVLDAGTGIRPLGNVLVGTAASITLMFTHLHTDHIAGFPFFAPLFEPDRRINLVAYNGGADTWSPLALMDGLHFPLSPAEVPASCNTLHTSAEEALEEQGVELSRLLVNHPGGAWGYRLQHDGRSFVFIPDNELTDPSPTTDMETIAAFCRGADVLCHDAQYVASERDARRGWGHSVVEDVCALARMAEVKHLMLFHHDPSRTDADLDHIQTRARRALHPDQISCTAAYEGFTLSL